MTDKEKKEEGRPIDIGAAISALQSGEDLSGARIESNASRTVKNVKNEPIEKQLEKIIAMQMDMYNMRFDEALKMVKEQWEKEPMSERVNWDKIDKNVVLNYVKTPELKEDKRAPMVIANTPEGDQEIREAVSSVLNEDKETKDIEDFIADFTRLNSNNELAFDWNELSESSKELLSKYLFNLAINGYIEKEYDVFIYRILLRTPTAETRLKVYREIEELNAKEAALSGAGMTRDHFTLIETIKNLKYAIVDIKLKDEVVQKFDKSKFVNILTSMHPETDADYAKLEQFLLKLDAGILDTMRTHLYNLSIFVSILSIYSGEILKNL